MFKAIIDGLIVHALLKVTTFIKRHPWISLLILVLMLIGPPLVEAIFAMVFWSDLLAGGKALGQKLVVKIEPLLTALKKPMVRWVLCGILFFVLPPVGILISIWFTVDWIKGKMNSDAVFQIQTPTPTSPTQNPPMPENPTPAKPFWEEFGGWDNPTTPGNP